MILVMLLFTGFYGQAIELLRSKSSCEDFQTINDKLSTATTTQKSAFALAMLQKNVFVIGAPGAGTQTLHCCFI